MNTAELKRGTDVPADMRLAMHWSMLRVRRVEEAIIRLYPEQEIRCPTHICIGHEAIAAGVSAHLTREDYAFSGHRSHGHYLAKGGDMKAMFAELYGRETGCAHGRGGSQHLIDLEAGFVASAPILAGMVPIAVGTALGARWRGLEGISVVYIGDGTTEEGSFHESLNYAATEKLPVIFVCENNLYSVHSDLAVRQPDRPISDLAKGHAMPGETADGNDSETVWRIAKRAIDRARDGGGPALLEFMTYRWYEHCGTNLDNRLGYRSDAEYAQWQARCPVKRSEAKLLRDGLLSESDIAMGEKRIAGEIADAVAFAKASPFPDPASLFRNVTPDL